MEFILSTTKDLQSGLEEVQEFLHKVSFLLRPFPKKKISSALTYLFGLSLNVNRYTTDETTEKFISMFSLQRINK